MNASYEDQEHDRRLLRKLVIELLNRYRWHQGGGQTTNNGFWESAMGFEDRERLMDTLDQMKVKYD